jgi:hypothetical protein
VKVRNFSDEVQEIRLLFSKSLTSRGVDQWLHAPNRLLGGDRPVERLKLGKVDEVRRVAAAFADGSYV